MLEDYNKQLKETKDFVDTLAWEDASFYGNFLAQTYYFVAHSTRLLARSISHFDVSRDNLYSRFIEHLKEENYHERIAKADLESIGFKVSDFEELAITKAFTESQFYQIDQSKGTSLLGYILYLEAIAVHCFEDVYKRLDKSYPQSGVKFVKVHMNEDPKHLENAIEQINGLGEKETQEIWKNFFQSAEIYHQMLISVEQGSAKIAISA